jgi:anti-anti-sigma factor
LWSVASPHRICQLSAVAVTAGRLRIQAIAAVVELDGDLDAAAAADLQDAVAIASHAYVDVVLDLQAVRLVDSVVLGLLVR